MLASNLIQDLNYYLYLYKIFNIITLHVYDIRVKLKAIKLNNFTPILNANKITPQLKDKSIFINEDYIGWVNLFLLSENHLRSSEMGGISSTLRRRTLWKLMRFNDSWFKYFNRWFNKFGVIFILWFYKYKVFKVKEILLYNSIV